MNREIKFRCWKKLSTYSKKFRMEYFYLMSYTYLMDGETMQYTGLKDKNGKEIYEGDIVKFMNSKSEVKWLIKNAGYLVKDKFGDWQWLYDVVGSTSCEIIGNIYENPDLLKGDK